MIFSLLQEFIEGNVAFSMKSDFRWEFCLTNVRSGVVFKFISYVLDTCKVGMIQLLFPWQLSAVRNHGSTCTTHLV